MYDAIAEVSGKFYEAAEVAATPAYGEVAKAVNGTLKHSKNPNTVSNAISRLVKRTGADTMLKNAERDGAQFAWVPNGDTCAFCITLASRGWQYMSKKALKNGHAEHIHANCDCTYAIRFDHNSGVKGYDPKVYEDMYYGAEGTTPNERINSLRRIHYEQNKELIRAQKRDAEEKRRQLSFDESTKTTFQRGKDIVASKTNDGRYGLYVSEDATLKKQGLDNIEKDIDSAIKALGIPENSPLPQIVVLSKTEMGTAYASYNFVDNRLFIRDDMGNKRLTVLYQNKLGFAAPNDPSSTARHELIHWMDAEEYRKNIGGINSNNSAEYLNYRREQSKIELDKEGINASNVSQVSKYAFDSFMYNDYDEAYTEYRVSLGE